MANPRQKAHMDDPRTVFLTLSHPLITRVENPTAEAFLASCCPHGAVPSLVRDGVVSLFLPTPGATLSVFLALVLPDNVLTPLSGPLYTSFAGTETGVEVVHVVEGCDTVPTTRRVLNATHSLHRVQPRGAVSSSAFLGVSHKHASDEAIDEYYDTEYQSPVLRCCEDLDLSMLSSPDLWFRQGTVEVGPKVLRFPPGGPRDMVESSAFFGKPTARLVFHPDTRYTRVGGSVFCFSHSLTTVDFRGLKNMPFFGNHLFQGCKNLTAVCMRGLPALKRIGDCVFVHCKELAYADCRDCPQLTTASDRSFNGNASDLHVLVDGGRQAKAVRDSMDGADRGHAVVVQQAELLEARRSDDPCLHRCPICEADDVALLAAADSSQRPASDKKQSLLKDVDAPKKKKTCTVQ